MNIFNIYCEFWFPFTHCVMHLHSSWFLGCGWYVHCVVAVQTIIIKVMHVIHVALNYIPRSYWVCNSSIILKRLLSWLEEKDKIPILRALIIPNPPSTSKKVKYHFGFGKIFWFCGCIRIRDWKTLKIGNYRGWEEEQQKTNNEEERTKQMGDSQSLFSRVLLHHTPLE